MLSLAAWFTSRRKDTMSHLHAVLEQTPPSRQPDFARYPTLLSRIVFISDPYAWPVLAKKTARILLSPKEIWNFMGLGPLVAPIPYTLFLCCLFCLLNDPKVKSVKRSTWVIAACVWIASMAALEFVENTEDGKRVVEELAACLAPWLERLPSLDSVDQAIERASQAVGLPLRFLPSWLFFAKLAHYFFLIFREVYSDLQNSQPQRAETGRQQPMGQRMAEQNDGQTLAPLRGHGGSVDRLRRHLSAIEEHLAVRDMRVANMQRILNESKEEDEKRCNFIARYSSTIASLPSGTQRLEEDSHKINAEEDGEPANESRESQQPPANDVPNLAHPAEGQTFTDQLSKQVDEEPEVKDQDIETSNILSELQQTYDDFSPLSTSPVEGLSLEDELRSSELEYESEFEEELEEHGDDGQEDNFDQSSLQMTFQTAKSSHSADDHEVEERQKSPQKQRAAELFHRTNDREDDSDQGSVNLAHVEYSQSEYSYEEDREQSLLQTAHQSAQPSQHADPQLAHSRPQPRHSVDLEDLSDLQYADDFDYHTVAEEMPGFLEPVYWKLEGQQESEKQQEQTNRAGELPRIVVEQFGDEYITHEEVEDFRREGQKDDDDKLPPDHLKTFSEAQTFTNKADEQHQLRTFNAFMEETNAEKRAQEQARVDREDELKNFHSGQAAIDQEDEHHNAHSLASFIEEGKLERQQEKKAQADRSEELKSFHQGQAFVDEEDERHNQQFLKTFIDEGSSEQQENSQPDLKALSDLQSFVGEDEVARTAQEVSSFIEEAKGKKQEQASQPDLKDMSNAQSFVEEDEVAQTSRDVHDFVKAGKSKQQETPQADLKAMSTAQAFLTDDEVTQTAQDVDKFIKEGAAEDEAQKQMQKDRHDELKNFQQDQAFVEPEDEIHTAQQVEDFTRESKELEEKQQQQQQQQPDLKFLSKAQFFGDKHVSDEEGGQEHGDDAEKGDGNGNGGPAETELASESSHADQRPEQRED